MASIQIGKIMGIPIRLHITFLLALPFFAWVFSTNRPIMGFADVESAPLRYVLSLSAALALFICVLLHELGHSYVAIKHGFNIRSITLFLFGGVSSMEEIPKNPKVEFKMALAGPGVSLLIGSAFLIVYYLFKSNNPIIGPYLRLIWLIGYINVVLFIFNLIPAFPMDGGRAFRAWLAGRMPYIRATHTAAGTGKMLAIFMGLLGFLTAAAGGIWIILIAFFIYIGASEEEKSTETSVILEGVKIKDVMSKDVKTVTSAMPIEELIYFMFKFKHMGYPVVDDTEVKGIVTFNDILKIPEEQRKNANVSQIMTKDVISLKENDDAFNALKIMNTNNIGRIIVMDQKKIVGIISRTDILRSMQILELYEYR